MIIESKFFGQVDIKDEHIINFENGIPGFEKYKRYSILDIEGSKVFKCLQSIDESQVSFIIVNPWDVIDDYEIDIKDSEIESIAENDLSNIFVYSVVNISEDRVTCNLMAPIIVNVKTHNGKQFVPQSSKYSIKHRIIEHKERK